MPFRPSLDASPSSSRVAKWYLVPLLLVAPSKLPTTLHRTLMAWIFENTRTPDPASVLFSFILRVNQTPYIVSGSSVRITLKDLV